jgi:hypothetical protein
VKGWDRISQTQPPSGFPDYQWKMFFNVGDYMVPARENQVDGYGDLRNTSELKGQKHRSTI